MADTPDVLGGWTAPRIAALFATYAVRPEPGVLYCRDANGDWCGCPLAVLAIAAGVNVPTPRPGSDADRDTAYVLDELARKGFHPAALDALWHSFDRVDPVESRRLARRYPAYGAGYAVGVAVRRLALAGVPA